jgi:hypothetical protein
MRRIEAEQGAGEKVKSARHPSKLRINGRRPLRLHVHGFAITDRRKLCSDAAWYQFLGMN